MVELNGLEVIPMRLNDGTDFLLFILREADWPLCEVVLGKGGFANSGGI